MIYFLIYLFLEVMLSTNIASNIGGWWVFLELIGSAFVGITILVNFRVILAQNMGALASRQIDVKKFQELNLFTILGAFLLIVPGFLTDIIGILFQFSIITSLFVNKLGAKYEPETPLNQNNHTKDSDVIDVEIISDSTSSK